MTGLTRLLPIFVLFSVGACSGGGGPQSATNSSPSGVSSGTSSALVAWTPPTLNDDTTTLTDLAGYRIYYGISPNALTTSATVEDPRASSYVVTGLRSGTYYFTVAAYNLNGLESNPSAQVVHTIE